MIDDEAAYAYYEDVDNRRTTGPPRRVPLERRIARAQALLNSLYCEKSGHPPNVPAEGLAVGQVAGLAVELKCNCGKYTWAKGAPQSPEPPDVAWPYNTPTGEPDPG